jgi:hypothetical protein
MNLPSVRITPFGPAPYWKIATAPAGNKSQTSTFSFPANSDIPPMKPMIMPTAANNKSVISSCAAIVVSNEQVAKRTGSHHSAHFH